MDILSKKRMIEELDRMNKDEFKYVGVMHIKSGYRQEVECHRGFIEDILKVKPIRQIRIREPLTQEQRELSKYAIVIECSPFYVNIYNVDDVKDKLKGISKKICLVILQYEEK